ncbi:hypothetical protein HaLaN_04144 [Haematococcus lacustris]|uniref:Uncharacterized protein n=1 Tax=Haematococcus lacustris TaxID=44745 RepID=A0A699YMI7_HAELA|nr:hypothetical protein HaLaN_04144 [Haematococcus lacustris]
MANAPTLTINVRPAQHSPPSRESDGSVKTADPDVEATVCRCCPAPTQTPDERLANWQHHIPDGQGTYGYDVCGTLALQSEFYVLCYQACSGSVFILAWRAYRALHVLKLRSLRLFLPAACAHRVVGFRYRLQRPSDRHPSPSGSQAPHHAKCMMLNKALVRGIGVQLICGSSSRALVASVYSYLLAPYHTSHHYFLLCLQDSSFGGLIEKASSTKPVTGEPGIPNEVIILQLCVALAVLVLLFNIGIWVVTIDTWWVDCNFEHLDDSELARKKGNGYLSCFSYWLAHWIASAVSWACSFLNVAQILVYACILNKVGGAQKFESWA